MVKLVGDLDRGGLQALGLGRQRRLFDGLLGLGEGQGLVLFLLRAATENDRQHQPHERAITHGRTS